VPDNEIVLFDRVRLPADTAAEPPVGTVVGIERRFPGGVTEIAYAVRVDGSARPREFTAEELSPTGESAAPFRFGQTVRIVAAGADDTALVGREGVVRGMSENHDGTFGLVLEVEGEPYVVAFHQSQVTAGGRR
jgi:hypothetical protein